MAPSSSPARQSRLYENGNESRNDLQSLMDSLNLGGGTEMVDLDDVASALRRQLNLHTGADDDSLFREMAKTFLRFGMRSSETEALNEERSPSSTSMKENEPATSTPAPAAMDTTPQPLNDSTPAASNGTPMSTVPKASSFMPSTGSLERGRPFSPFSQIAGSRSKTPSKGSCPRASPTTNAALNNKDLASTQQETHRMKQSPARHRSPSLTRGFFRNKLTQNSAGTSGTTAVQPPSSQIPAQPADRSGLPRTPVRPASSQVPSGESSFRESPAAMSAASFPSPPSTGGATFASPDPTQFTAYVPGGSASPNKRTDHENECLAGVSKIPRKTATPVGIGCVSATTAAPSGPVSSSSQASSVQNGFHVGAGGDTNKTKRSKFRQRRNMANVASNRHQQHVPVRLVPPSPEQPVVPPQFPSTETSMPSVSDQNASTFAPSPPAHSSSDVPDSPMNLSPEHANGTAASNAVPTTSPMFNMGAGGKPSSPGLKQRPRRNPRKVGLNLSGLRKGANMRSRQSRWAAVHLPTPDPAKEDDRQERSTVGILPNPSYESAGSSSAHTLRTASSDSSEVDYSGRKAHVASLREDARAFYTRREYPKAVLTYTKALKEHIEYRTDGQEEDDLRAILLANRSAVLFMLEAYAAAAADCQEALSHVSSTWTSDVPLATECGHPLKAKILLRMGKSLLKLGKLQEAEQAFSNATNTAKEAKSSLTGDQGQNQHIDRFLSNLITEAETGKLEVSRCRDNSEGVRSGSSAAFQSPSASSRRLNMQSLLCLNTALHFAPESVVLNEKKIDLLAKLKRWRELAGHCERLAARSVKSDGLFEGDLAHRNPFPGVPRATALRHDFFDNADTPESSTLKLNSKAAGEAALRLPFGLLPYYLRALRLEERYAMCSSALAALEELRDGDPASYRVKFAWLTREKDKLDRTVAGKNRGDNLFRTGDYELAAAQYTSCLSIDAEGLSTEGLSEGANAGGRLHAVLHCNRAACLMAMNKYQEAVTDCTAALRIHTTYMKAVLRRSRCYARLERYEESIVEYKRWIELVEDARKSSDSAATVISPCIFDRPQDVSDEDLEKVKRELGEVMRSKRAAANAAKEDSSFHEGRRQWHNETFGRAQAGDAHRRREQWYNQRETSWRRWDSFSGKSPKRGASGRRFPDGQQEQHHERRSSQQLPKRSPGSDDSKNHYAVLAIDQNATNAQIKSAYRRMALRYHPDKNKEECASDMFRRAKQAYDVLNDEESRRKYDAQLRWNRMYTL